MAHKKANIADISSIVNVPLCLRFSGNNLAKITHVAFIDNASVLNALKEGVSHSGNNSARKNVAANKFSNTFSVIG